MSTRNLELKTASIAVTSNTAAINIGGQVPAGMKRWVTFLSVDTMYDAGRVSDVGVYLASVGVSNPTIASMVLTANRKLYVPMEGTQMSRSNKARPHMLPSQGPDPDNPLFSIAAEKWLGVCASLTSANIFCQYFDE